MANSFDAVRYTLVDASGNPASVPTNTHDAERIQLVDGNGNVIDPSDILNDSLAATYSTITNARRQALIFANA